MQNHQFRCSDSFAKNGPPLLCLRTGEHSNVYNVYTLKKPLHWFWNVVVNMMRLGLARLRLQQVCFGWNSDDHCHDHSPPGFGHLQIMWTEYLQAPSPKVQYSEKAIVNSACVKKTFSTWSCFMYSLILCAFCASAQLLQVKGQCWILTETLCGDPLLLLVLE